MPFRGVGGTVVAIKLWGAESEIKGLAEVQWPFPAFACSLQDWSSIWLLVSHPFEPDCDSRAKSMFTIMTVVDYLSPL